MSTSLFAVLNLGDEAQVHFHMGKWTSTGFSTLSGRRFPTLEAWRTFLIHNENDIEIVGNNGPNVPSLEEILEALQPSENERESSQYQLGWLRDHGFSFHDKPVPWKWSATESGQHWIDHGQLFYNGYFR